MDYNSANIYDKAVTPPSSVGHSVGTYKPDLVLPDGRPALLLPRNSVHSCAFQELKTHCPPGTNVVSGDIICCQVRSTVDVIVLELLRF